MASGTVTRKDIEEVVVKLLRDLVAPEDLPTDPGPQTGLFGDDGALDSVGLVSLVVAVEQALEEQFGAVVSLADEKALSQRHSPYRTVGSLAEYASSQL